MSKDIFDFEDIEFDKFEKFSNKKKKINCGIKGKSSERKLCKILNDRFPGKVFSRNVGSGNRFSQVKLGENAKQYFVGDLSCTFSQNEDGQKFLWTAENKAGYSNIDLNNLFEGIPQIDKFIKQIEKDAEFCGKKPVCFWKRDRKPWLVMCKQEDLYSKDHYWLPYKNYAIMTLKDFLSFPDEVFFG